jgi:predicted dehydrogenase
MHRRGWIFMESRRIFIGRVASGLAGTLAASTGLGANTRIRAGLIGAGDRGRELLREMLACSNVECAGVADVYSRRLDEARVIAPNARTYADYRALLEDKSIDAVLVATPQHLHARHFIDSLEAGKHVYQEKTMAFTVDDAKQMRAAHRRAGRRVVQIGHQWTSSGQVADAQSFLKPELIGKITAINAHMYRNTPHGKPQWARPVYPGMDEANIDWRAFLGDAPERPFDANRFLNWRFFWDYSGGNVFENMCQQVAFWYKTLDLEIPRCVTMTGGLFLWKDGREVPDTMHVSMEQPEELLFSWVSGFGNDRPGIGEEALGTDGTVSRSQQIRYTPQKVNRPRGNEMAGQTRTEPRAHMQNFLDAIRGSAQVNCPFDVGFKVSIACRMAVESYRLQRTVRWDPEKEAVV